MSLERVDHRPVLGLLKGKRPGLVLELAPGESLAFTAAVGVMVDVTQIVVLVEAKRGQRARVRVQAPENVQIHRR